LNEPRLYLDYNATAPLLPEARDALLDAMGAPGNASSVHAEGRQARRRVEAARASVGRLVGAGAGAVVFTSGATEANVTALTPNYFRGGKPVTATHLIVSAVEHPSSLKSSRFAPEATLTSPVDAAGLVDLARLEALLREVNAAGGVPLVACQLANNETGVIQPIAEIASLVAAAGGILHCDAVQAAGRVPIDMAALGVDTLSLSAHKMAPRRHRAGCGHRRLRCSRRGRDGGAGEHDRGRRPPRQARSRADPPHQPGACLRP
jgi:cysteine desulfurase